MLDLQFEWDPAKSEANLRRRGFDFAYASLVFAGPTLEVEDTRRDYGEQRLIAVGLVAGECLTVAYTDRTVSKDLKIRRIIAAWRSSRRERAKYALAAHSAASGVGPRGLGTVS